MLHKRLGLLSFPNGKRAVPPTESGERKKHTSRRRHNMEKAQTCSKPWATEMLGCSCRGSEQWEWESEQGTSISQIGGGGVFAFFKEYFLSSLVSRPRAKGPKTREGQELFEEIRFWKWQWPKSKSSSLTSVWGCSLFEVWRGQLLLPCAGFLTTRQPLGHSNLHQFQVKEDKLQFRQGALSASWHI